jgi:uncharacterized membrane protein
MSSKNLSKKEQDVLARQRRLAASMQQKKQKKQQAAAATSAGGGAKKTTAPALKRPSAPKLKRPSTARTAAAQALKRPATASAVLAAARNKAALEKAKQPTDAEVVDLTSPPPAAATASSTTTTSSSSIAYSSSVPSIPRAKKSASNSNNQNNNNKTPSAFSSLVKSAATTNSSVAAASEDDLLYASSNADSLRIPTMEPDDFWKHLRDWDFASQLYQQLEQQHDPNSDKFDVPVKKQQLPEIFLNARHYVAAWAPLCLAETRAQILSEWFSTNDIIGSGRTTMRQQAAGVLVTATITTEHRGSSSRRTTTNNRDPYMLRLEPEDSLCLKIKVASGQGRIEEGYSFMTNDIVLLVPVSSKDLFLGLCRGKYQAPDGEFASSNAFKKWGLVIGHTKCARKTPNDLIIEVSKRKWAMVPSSSSSSFEGSKDNATNNTTGDQTLWLWKLGSNVTALREFTALCRMDQLPLKHFLLGQHLDPHNTNNSNPQAAIAAAKTKQDTTNEEQEGKTKTDLLSKMGGSQALGKGFTAYAQQKFNPSQLMAIAASAHEYGDGGFTLIKGPPGTGSKYINIIR